MNVWCKKTREERTLTMTLLSLGVRVQEGLTEEAHLLQERQDSHDWMNCLENFKYVLLVVCLIEPFAR